MKTKETQMIENLLEDDTRKKRIYGCKEVTVGFPWQCMGREIADYITIDTKDIIRCYEVKVTMQDLKSKSKKSFYGHYNYLAVTEQLWQKIEKSGICLSDYGIPDWAGIISFGTYSFSSVRKAAKQDISQEQLSILKTSIIRSMYWKMEKYRMQADGTALQKERKETSRYRRMYKESDTEKKQLLNSIYQMQQILRERYHTDFHIYPGFSAERWADEISRLADSRKEKRSRENTMSVEDSGISYRNCCDAEDPFS